MGRLEDKHERAVGDEFFEWFNAEMWTAFAFVRRGGEAPDLVYAWNGVELGVEITGAYYDAAHGAFLWKSARGAADAPRNWVGVNPHRNLADAVVECIRAKSRKRYGAGTILLVNIPPGLTSAEELANLLVSETLPDVGEFESVYVCGRFPITISSSGGYRVIPVKEPS